VRCYDHVFGGGLAELDVADGILEGRELGAWAAWRSILTDLGMAELELLAIRISVDVDVCDAHCECGWHVWR
jgi:hypothetical protein